MGVPDKFSVNELLGLDTFMPEIAIGRPLTKTVNADVGGLLFPRISLKFTTN
jgi:hypothetical protein